MKLSDILMLYSGILLAGACKFIEDIRDINISLEVLGVGLHPHLLISTNIASINRFSECRILYEIDIPNGAYVDSDSVNSSLSEHSLFSDVRFDVEAPADKSEDHKVYILRTNTHRKTFVIEDKLTLPVHLRYHACKYKNGATEATTIKFNTPVIAFDCWNDYQPLNLEACSGKKKYKIAGLESKSPYWIIMEPLDKKPAVALIPVGNCSQIPIIFFGTILTLLIGLYCIFSAQKGSKVIHKVE